MKVGAAKECHLNPGATTFPLHGMLEILSSFFQQVHLERWFGILILVGYSTCNPEAVQLQKHTSQHVARELLTLFSCVGILKDNLTNQGTPFISRLMVDLCRLLQVNPQNVCLPPADGWTSGVVQPDTKMDDLEGGRREGTELGPPPALYPVRCLRNLASI